MKMKLSVTTALLGINFVFYIIQIATLVFTGNAFFTEFLGLSQSTALSGSIWEFITYTFLHDIGNPLHIFINMFVLMIFGFAVEESLGAKKYILLYIVSGIGSAILFMALTFGAFDSLLIGASGSVFGIITAYAYLYPKNVILVGFIFPVPAWLAVIGLVLIEIFFGVFGIQEGVANFGHIGGILTSLILMTIFRYGREKRPIEERGFEFVWE